MMDSEWKYITESLQSIKPEYRDMEYLKKRLDWCYNYDVDVLDNLFMMKAITTEEYIKYAEKVQKNQEYHLQNIKERIEKAKNNPDDFTPMIYYCLGRDYLGAGIENANIDEWHKKWSNNNGQ